VCRGPTAWVAAPCVRAARTDTPCVGGPVPTVPSREVISRSAVKRSPSAPSWIIQALGADRSDIRREEVAHAPRSRTVRPCDTDRSRLRREHHHVVRSSVWHPSRRQNTFWRLRWDQVSRSAKNQALQWMVLKITLISPRTIS
jgi:hypothetical protein